MKNQAVKNLEEIIERISTRKEYLQDKFKIKEIGVFGSFVRGEQKTRRSDVDILVEFEEENIPSLLEFIAIERHLARLLKKKVELVRKEAIRPEIRDIILKEAIYI